MLLVKTKSIFKKKIQYQKIITTLTLNNSFSNTYRHCLRNINYITQNISFGIGKKFMRFNERVISKGQ